MAAGRQSKEQAINRMVYLLRHAVAFWERRPLRWRAGLDDEEAFWRNYFSSGGGEWAANYGKRWDASLELQDDIKQVLAEIGPRVRILDVGAGPLTTLGKCWDGERLESPAVDPLADRYDRLLAMYDNDPPVRTIRCDGEELVATFGPDAFDVAFAKNAVDHSYDPVLVLRQMVTVVKPGGPCCFSTSKTRPNARVTGACFGGTSACTTAPSLSGVVRTALMWRSH